MYWFSFSCKSSKIIDLNSLSLNNEDLKVIKKDLDSNILYISFGKFNNDNFDTKIVNLTKEEDTLKLVKLQNKTQEKYAREFIALHEAAHCEFETIKNPVQDFSKDSKFNEKLNYVIFYYFFIVGCF